MALPTNGARERVLTSTSAVSVRGDASRMEKQDRITQTTSTSCTHAKTAKNVHELDKIAKGEPRESFS